MTLKMDTASLMDINQEAHMIKIQARVDPEKWDHIKRILKTKTNQDTVARLK